MNIAFNSSETFDEILGGKQWVDTSTNRSITHELTYSIKSLISNLDASTNHKTNKK